MTNGASEGISLWLRALLDDPNDGIMIPVPQYPIYSALITLYGGKMVNYYLDESKNWALNSSELQKEFAKAKDKGIKVKAITVINPGNPTG